MRQAGRKRCVVAYATREHQYLWTVDLPAQATVADAIEAARGWPRTLGRREARGKSSKNTWDTAPVGIFGEPASAKPCRQRATESRSTTAAERSPRDAGAKRCAATEGESRLGA